MCWCVVVCHHVFHRMELNTKFPGHVYMVTCEDTFFFLTKHYSGLTEVNDNEWYGEQRKYLDKTVSDIKFALVRVPDEDMEEGVKELWNEGGKYDVTSVEVGR